MCVVVGMCHCYDDVVGCNIAANIVAAVGNEHHAVGVSPIPGQNSA